MLSNYDYDRIFALRDEGKSLAKIGEMMGMDWRRVKTILESLHKEKDYSPNTLTDSGKWPAIRERIEEMYEKDKLVFTHQVTQAIKEEFGETVTNNCVVRVREEIGLGRKQARYGAMVREPNRPKRVDWALEKKANKEMFLDVFFADEASVVLENQSGFVWVKWDDKYGHIIPQPKHRLRVMIWIAISMMGPTQVKIFGPKESCKGEDYCRVIEEYYLPASKALYGGDCRLVHDNAPVHTSGYTVQRLAQLGVKTDSWPAESPDMMPVELVFAYLKDRLRNQYKPKNKAELVAAIQQFHQEYLTVEYCQSLIRRIHTTMKQVIRREGHPVRGKAD